MGSPVPGAAHIKGKHKNNLSPAKVMKIPGPIKHCNKEIFCSFSGLGGNIEFLRCIHLGKPVSNSRPLLISLPDATANSNILRKATNYSV